MVAITVPTTGSAAQIFKRTSVATNNTTKFRVDRSGNTTVNDLTTYNAHVNRVLNIDGGLNICDYGVNKLIMLHCKCREQVL